MRILQLTALAIVLTSSASAQDHTSWGAYLGGPDSAQYSALKQINKSNVNKLEVAWTYATGEKGNYLFNPIIVDGVMYVLAKSNSIVALDAATGKELWTHPNQGGVGTRGISYWESKDRADRRLLYVNAGFLTALDARTGETILSFGDNGRTDLRIGLDRDIDKLRPMQTSNPGRIFENLLIQPLPAPPGGDDYNASPGDVHAYDVRTGKLAWVFHTVPHPGEFGYDTWPKEAWKTSGGVHNWNEMTVDEKRGIAYIPLGTARYDFYGADRYGANLFGNSLLALDARTGKRLWHFQLVHHDLWDYDLPTAPKLLTVKQGGKSIDAVAQPTKQGFLFVFNRVTGEPLWPIEERAVPKSDVAGEEAWPTQPFPTKPPPFARQSFTEQDINPYLSETERDKVREELKTWRNEGLFTPPSLQGTLEIPGNNGGANWGSSAVDPTKGTMYIVSKELPMGIKLQMPRPRGPGRGAGQGKAAPQAPPEQTAAPLPTLPPLEGGFPRYTAPYDFMTSASNRLSAIGPPWSQLTAYDLNTGTIKWQVPNGGVSALEAEGHSGTGAHFPRGGVVATAGGLIFVATASDRKVRAYDQDTGKVIWEKELPAGSEGVPAVFQINGREYLVLCVAAGDGLMNTRVETSKEIRPPAAGSYIAFALPAK
jgi:glucose dehydrogenase